MAKLIIQRQRRKAQYFIEDLGNEVSLDMVLIPGGNFMMGALQEEESSGDDELPQHSVTVPLFFMGKYPVTQGQWKAVAAMPQVNRELEPDPSKFKGNDRPVEKVSWYKAVEFCERLSQHTKRTYRLPSEAEWEYACRAGTTTPFHFGRTISTDLANYRGNDWELGGTTYSGSYGEGEKGIFRNETTPVGSFKVANAFGLFDMHGNVWEWCADSFHWQYEGAPTDGSAWIEGGDGSFVLRGGSWDSNPGYCRSAIRNNNSPDVLNNDFGFRVVCSAFSTLQ